MSGWVTPMLISGGLFAGGASFFAWERVPAWRAMSAAEFEPDFAQSVRRADRVQPALLIACLISTVGFALSVSGTARAIAIIGGAGLLLTLAGSGAFLVPLQRRLIAGAGEDAELLRRRWYAGHLLRTVLALTSFVVLVVAVTI